MRGKTARILISLVVLVGVAAASVVVWRTVASESQVSTERPFPPTPVSPEVVALVNGRPISGQALDILVQNGGKSAQGALNGLINDELLYQAAQRLGLAATEQEITASIRAEEEALPDMTEEQREFYQWFYAEQGISTEDMVHNPRLRETARASVTIAHVREFITERAAAAKLAGVSADTIDSPAALETVVNTESPQFADAVSALSPEEMTAALDEFLTKERDAADIQMLTDPGAYDITSEP